MTADHYKDETLSNHLIPSIDLLYPLGERCIFQQDNAPPHRATRVKEWFRENRIEVLDWPSYSPDINPIENVWGLLKQRLYRDLPRTPAAVMETFRVLWLELTPQYAENLAMSMFRRVDRVIARRGLRT